MQNVNGQWEFRVYLKNYYGLPDKFIGTVKAIGIDNLDARLNATKIAHEKYNIAYRDIGLF